LPTITIDGPPIADVEKRRSLVRGLTDVAGEAFGIEKAHIVVLIRENQPQNVGIGGELLSDRRGGRGD